MRWPIKISNFFLGIVCLIGSLSFPSAGILSCDAAIDTVMFFARSIENQVIPDKVINTIKQTNSGLLLIGTRQGLFTYDGFKCRLVEDSNKQSSLSTEFIQDILVHRDTIWVGTMNGLFRWEWKKQRIQHWASTPETGLPSYHIHSIFKDSTDRLWVCTDGRNPVYFDHHSQKFISIPWKDYVKNKGISDKDYLSVFALAQKGLHSIWLFTNIGLFDYDISSGKFHFHKKASESGNIPMTWGMEYPQGNLCIHLDGLGMAMYNWEANEVQYHLLDPKSLMKKEGKRSYEIGILSAFELLVPTDQGAIIWDLKYKKWKAVSFLCANEKMEPISSSKVVFIDAEGSIWLGGNRRLLHIDLAGQVASWQKIPKKKQGLVISVASKDSGILIGYQNPWSLVYCKKTNFEECKLITENISDIVKIIPGPNGTFIVATQENLFIFDEGTHTLKPMKSVLPRGVFVTDICFGKWPNLWVSTLRHGLHIIDLVKQSSTQLNGLEIQGVSLSNFSCIYIDTIRQIALIGSQSNYIVEYDLSTFKMINHFFQVGDVGLNLSLPSMISPLTKKSYLIVGAVFGFSKLSYEGAEPEIENFYLRDKIEAIKIDHLHVDPNQNIWIATGSQLFCITQDGRLYPLHRFVWKGPLEYYPKVFTIDNNHVACIDSDCLTVFNLNKIKLPSFKPKIFISGLRTHKGSYGYDPNQPVKLGHKEQYFSVENSLGSFSGIESYRYFYRVLGIHADWVQIQDPSSINLVGLSPGKYKYQIKACTGSFICSVAQQLDIEILPKFTQTGWFVFLLCLGFVGLVYGVYKYRIGQYKQLEFLRSSIAADLHDDVSSTVSSISYYAEFCRSKISPENEGADDILRKIGENAREALENIREAIWTIKRPYFHEDELAQRIIEFGKNLCEIKQIEVVVQQQWQQKKVKLTALAARNIYLIAKETICNAIKHGNPTQLLLSFESEKNCFYMKICDDGKGFDLNNRNHNGNGLINIQERAAQIKAAVKIQSIPARGTQVSLTLNLRNQMTQ